MFRALLAHPQQALHKRHLVYCVRVMSVCCIRIEVELAIWPVSLWALVVELHPLNGAHAQAVRRISDKVAMKELEEQCVCVKFCCELGKNFTETFQLLNQAYGEDGERVSWIKKSTDVSMAHRQSTLKEIITICHIVNVASWWWAVWESETCKAESQNKVIN
jgi:hypothetical protein